MRTVTLTATACRCDADAVFATLCDFGRYAELTDAVREVTVTPVDATTIDSAWAVNFRSGILKWTERDRIDAAARRIDFVQTDGDFDVFAGSWTVRQSADDTHVTFTAHFDLGMPSLASIIDPIAERTLVENMRLILQGLIGPTVAFTTDAAADAPATAELAGAF